MNHAIADAQRAWEAAACRLTNTVKREWPVGTILRVEIGRSIFLARVTGHLGWSVEPYAILGENIATGKTRKFYPSSVLHIVSKP